MHGAGSIQIKSRGRLPAGFVVATVAMAACAPALDWRRLPVPELGLSVLLPCKPQRLAEASQALWQCEADGLRFVLTWQHMSDPRQAQARLAGQAPAMAQRMGGQAQLSGAQRLPSGALDWPGRGRYLLAGGDRQALLQLWVQGLHLCQLLVVGARAELTSRELHTAETFMGSLQRLETP
jgi:hypothetical protein